MRLEVFVERVALGEGIKEGLGLFKPDGRETTEVWVSDVFKKHALCLLSARCELHLSFV